MTIKPARCFACFALATLAAAPPASAQDSVDVSQATTSPWRMENRGATLVSEGGRRLLRFDERPDGGMVWNPALQLGDGDIDVDVRGRDVLQKSFVGIAFHIRSAHELDVVWLRPFNFRSDDPARRAHAVQFASYPAFSWQVLREQHPGAFEASVPPDIAPDSWIHLHLEVRGSRVRLFLNGASAPVLDVESPSGRTSGAVGLWVGDQSPGDFSGLVIHRVEGDSYGFLARLGRDTVSLERVTRTRDRLVSDAVERFPRVIQRHTEIEFGPDGAIRHMFMDITLPTAVTPKWRARRVTADYQADSVRLTIRNGEGTRTVTLGTDGQPMLPWTAQLYSLTELYFATGLRRGGDSIALRHYYVDMQADDYPFPPGLRPGGFVRALPGGKAEIFRHDGLSGSGDATLDGDRKLLAYSGARSTYKVEVVRLAEPPDVEPVAARFAELERQAPVAADVSVRDTARGAIGKARLVIDYGRPLARGRTLVGGILPYGEVWRTGANAATQFTTSAAITLAGLELVPGTYTLWTIPSRDGVQLIVSRQFGQWGTQYDPSRDLGRAALVATTSATPVERFTVSVTATDPHHGTLVLEWGTFHWTAAIVVR